MVQTDLWRSIMTNRNFEGITSSDFAVFQQATRVTRGSVLAAVA
jgi:hypothetical protein